MNEVLVQALKDIEKFGHTHGHGRGYTCADIALKALKEAGIQDEKTRYSKGN